MAGSLLAHVGNARQPMKAALCTSLLAARLDDQIYRLRRAQAGGPPHVLFLSG